MFRPLGDNSLWPYNIQRIPTQHSCVDGVQNAVLEFLESGYTWMMFLRAPEHIMNTLCSNNPCNMLAMSGSWSLHYIFNHNTIYFLCIHLKDDDADAWPWRPGLKWLPSYCNGYLSHTKTDWAFAWEECPCTQYANKTHNKNMICVELWCNKSIYTDMKI